jgi:hypothetical protein
MFHRDFAGVSLVGQFGGQTHGIIIRQPPTTFMTLILPRWVAP